MEEKRRGITGWVATGWAADRFDETDELAKKAKEREKKFADRIMNPKPPTRQEVKSLSRR